MRRPGRHVRHVVLRLQLPPDRLRAPAGPQGDLRDLRHRRPLDRRRALARRGAATGRPRRLRPLHDADVRAAAGARGLGHGRRQGLVRRVGASAGDLRAVGADVAPREPPRALLGPRVGASRWHHRGLRSDRVPGDDRGGLGRRLPQQLVPHRRRAGQGGHTPPPARRPVGPRRPGDGDARAADRLRRGDGGVVRPLAARDRYPPGPLRPLRPHVDATRDRPRPARGLVGHDADGPAGDRGDTRPDRPGVARRGAGRRHRCLDRLRGPPPVGTVRRPAARRRALADLGDRARRPDRSSATRCCAPRSGPRSRPRRCR